MNADVKAKWLEALRSGEYEQGRDSLRQGEAFCCLGVLCDVAIKSGLAVKVARDNLRGFYYDNEESTLPQSVRDWANVSATGLMPSLGASLTEYNDGGMAFDEIADVIEAVL